MVFLLNNIFLTLTLFILLSVGLLLAFRIYRQWYWNKWLSHNHKVKRLEQSPTYNTGISFAKGTAVLTPFLATMLVLLVSVNIIPNESTSLDETIITNASQVLNLKASFEVLNKSSKDIILSDVITQEYDGVQDNVLSGNDAIVTSSLLEIPSSENNDSVDVTDDYLLPTYQEKIPGEFVNSDDLDDVYTDGSYIYVVFGQVLYVVHAYDEFDTYEIMETELLLTFDLESDGVLLGVYADDLYLHVLLQKDHSVIVKSYVKDNEFETNFEARFEGYLIGTKKINGILYILTQSSELDSNTVNLELPSYDIYGNTTTTTFSDLIYADGVVPNRYITLYAYNPQTHNVKILTMLGDDVQIYATDTSLYIIHKVYFLRPLSNIVSYEESYFSETSLIQSIDLTNESELQIENMKVIDGYLQSEQSITSYNNYLYMILENDSEVNMISLDDSLQTVSTLSDIQASLETISSTYFIDQMAFIIDSSNTQMNIIDISDPNNLNFVGVVDFEQTPKQLSIISSHLAILVEYAFLDTGESYGISVKLIDFTNPNSIEVIQSVVFEASQYYIWENPYFDPNYAYINTTKDIIAIPFQGTLKATVGVRTVEDITGMLMVNLEEESSLQIFGIMEYTSGEAIKALTIGDYIYTVGTDEMTVSSVSSPLQVLRTVQFLYKE
jgi:hypothetical protein